MKTEKNFIDYGIYIDGKTSFIISLNHNNHEVFIENQPEENDSISFGSNDVHPEHIQNRKNEYIKKFCKSIIEKLITPHSILIFGPSETKYELQKEIRENKSLKDIKEELKVTDYMEKVEATRYAQDHFTSTEGIKPETTKS